MTLNLVTPSFMSRCVNAQMPRRRPAIFLDAGSLLSGSPAESVLPALHQLGRIDYRLVVLAQREDSLRWGGLNEPVSAVRARLLSLFGEACAALAGCYACPHEAPMPDAEGRRLTCLCRKPMPGLLHRAASELGLDRRGAWLIGERLDDIEAGQRAGCRTILLSTGKETRWQAGPYRSPHYLVRHLGDAARVIADHRRVPRTRPAASPSPSPSPVPA